MKYPRILITGATGNIGAELTKKLSALKIPFTAMLRSVKKAEGIASLGTADLVTADFNDAKSIASALNGIDRVFLLTNSSDRAEVQQREFVRVAKDTGIQQIVKLSQWAAASDSPVRFLRYHAEVEQKIRESGISYTFLRPNLFMQGFLAFREAIRTEGKFFAPIGDAKISVVDVRDIAAAATAALTEDGHEGKIYNLTGPESLTHSEMADTLSIVLQRPIQFVDVPPEAMLQALLQFGLPNWQAEGLIEDFAHYKRGEAARIESGVFDATAKPPKSFKDFARDYAPAFS